jgi:hypothetical protein
MFAASKTASVSGGYQISRSLRFNSADSANLTRTLTTPTNNKIWTWSGWIKFSSINTTQGIFCAPITGTTQDQFRLESGGSLGLYWSASNSGALVTTQVFRDPSAWYHFVVAVDTTQATASNRAKIYVNGSQITSFSSATYPDFNFTQKFNSAVVHDIGGPAYDGSLFFSGYMTEVNFIDGQALTPSSFGETNAQTGVWQPKAYSGSYGTNGFYLNFSDNSNTTAATLGKDYSGNGNNWTPNNFSVTAGAGNDSLVDSPTSYGVDTGVGGTVRGNYCTLNPLNAGSTATLSNGNLDITGTIAATTSLAYSTIGVSSGKWYWEVTPLTGDHMIGIGKDGGRYDWQTTNGYSYFGNNGQKYTNSAGSAYGATYANNDVIGVGLDMDAGTLTFYKNGTSQGTAFSGLTGTWFPIAQNPGSPLTEAFNFGQRPFAYTAPSGFKALCTQNLPTPTIGATTATQAGKFFNPVLYTGTGSSLGVTGVGFQPDWTWIKLRSAVADHALYDAVRGVQKQLESNNTTAETTETNGLTAFGSDGFTVGTLSQVNGSGGSYVAWNWKANGSGSSNTAGSITSTVSASTTSGFSIVTYTGTGANATFGHGLGVTPSMVIIKQRSNAGIDWIVWHTTFSSTQYMTLNTTAAVGTGATLWNSTTPTSTLVSIGTDVGTNQNTITYVAYCFAEVAGYSKFGSYTGNGSADGPFVFTGFRPAYVMVKATISGTADWAIHDVARNTYNVVDNTLLANLSDAEYTSNAPIDMVSNGFKIRTTNPNWNTNTGTYIYICFASNPFKYSLAR